MFVDQFRSYLAESKGAFLLTEEWGFMVYEFRNNFICICDLFIHWDFRGGDTLSEVLYMVEKTAIERNKEFIGFKLSASVHGFDDLVRVAEENNFERISVQPEYILFLRRVRQDA